MWKVPQLNRGEASKNSISFAVNQYGCQVKGGEREALPRNATLTRLLQECVLFEEDSMAPGKK